MPPQLGTYVPTLANRAAELKGLEFLPALSKDKMHPLFLLAPWPNALQLSRAIERIEKAFLNRAYFLDIDRDYITTDPEQSAQIEWRELKDPAGNFAAWRNFWSEYSFIKPCLQLEGQDQNGIVNQIREIQNLDREFCLRIELKRLPNNLADAIAALVEVGTSDYTVIIEGGWISDPIMMGVEATGLIQGVLEPLSGRVPIVVSCTSIRKGFHDITGTLPHPFTNRELIDQIRGNTNRANILYGDWGSTKPREQGGGRRPLPRIDYPTNNSWVFARNKGENWDFREAAEAIVNSEGWDGNLNIWGEQMIEQAASGSDVGIDTPQKNIAARVNIHLHRQALYGTDFGGINLDEPWED